MSSQFTALTHRPSPTGLLHQWLSQWIGGTFSDTGLKYLVLTSGKQGSCRILYCILVPLGWMSETRSHILSHVLVSNGKPLLLTWKTTPRFGFFASPSPKSTSSNSPSISFDLFFGIISLSRIHISLQKTRHIPHNCFTWYRITLKTRIHDYNI